MHYMQQVADTVDLYHVFQAEYPIFSNTFVLYHIRFHSALHLFLITFISVCNPSTLIKWSSKNVNEKPISCMNLEYESYPCWL